MNHRLLHSLANGEMMREENSISSLIVMDHLHSKINATIERLARDYRDAPGIILTEDDLKCLLVSRLLEIPELRCPRRTADHQVFGTMVHTEVSWFDENGELRIKPDITILNPRKLSIFHNLRRGLPLPRKGFNFAGSSIIFELKFIRGRAGVTRACLRDIEGDLAKVLRLFDRLSLHDIENELYCFFVIFSKVDRYVPEFAELINQARSYRRCRIIFETAGVHWPAASSPSISVPEC